MARFFFVLGSLSAFLGVALGAFLAHALKNRLSPAMFDVFETGIRYQMYHSFALFVVAWAASHWQTLDFSSAGWCFASGILLFSGSLYLLAFTNIRWFGYLTPIGGLLFLWGWFFLVWTLWKIQPLP